MINVPLKVQHFRTTVPGSQKHWVKSRPKETDYTLDKEHHLWITSLYMREFPAQLSKYGVWLGAGWGMLYQTLFGDHHIALIEWYNGGKICFLAAILFIKHTKPFDLDSSSLSRGERNTSTFQDIIFCLSNHRINQKLNKCFTVLYIICHLSPPVGKQCWWFLRGHWEDAKCL